MPTVLKPSRRFTRMRSLFLLFAFALWSATPGFAADIYVAAATGSDAADCTTPSLPCRTIQVGIDKASPGDTVNVAAGTYLEQVEIDKDNLTLLGAGPVSTLLQSDASCTNQMNSSAVAGVRLLGDHSGIRLEGFSVSGYDIGLDIGENIGNIIADVTVEDVDASNNCVHGLLSQAGDTSGVTISNSAFNNNGSGFFAGRGIWLINGTKAGIGILDNEVRDNRLIGIDISEGDAADVQIRRNTVVGNGDTGISLNGPEGADNVIAFNTVTDNGRFGIVVANPGGATGVLSNSVSLTGPGSDTRDYAGIAVYRRGPGATNADQPSGVEITENTVSGFVEPNGDGEGFGIVVEGTNMLVQANNLTGNDVGIQVQEGNPRPNTNGTAYFDRGDASVVAEVDVINNNITANGAGLRAIGTSNEIDGTRNWWGDADGPSGEGAGAGDSVSTGVDFCPWRVASYPDISSTLFGCSELSVQDTLGSEDVGAVFLPIRSTAAMPASFTVDFTTVDGEATAAGGDYAPVSGTLTFAGNQQSEDQLVRFDVFDDVEVEPGERVFIEISNPSDPDLTITGARGFFRIVDNDSASVTIDDVTLNEGDSGTSSMVFTVTPSAPVAGGFTVDYATADGTALAGSDYAAAAGTLTFAGTAGETQSITVPVSGDTTVEADETVFVNLSNLQAGGLDVTLADAEGQGTIVNDDAAAITIDDVTVSEGDSGTASLVFTVTSDAQAPGGFTIDYATADGTALVDGDYTAVAGTLTFAGTAGETQSITVPVSGDTTVEADETVFVNLSNLTGSGVQLADAQGEGTIVNDDAAAITIDDVTVSEGDSGTASLVFTVTSGAEVSGGFTVNYATADGTALAGGDYTAAAGTLTFAGTAGETQSITVPVSGDTTVEADETVFVNLSNPQAGGLDVTLADAQGQGTIVNDDSALVSVDDVSDAEGFAGTTDFVFTVTLDNAVAGGFSLDFATADDSATTADDDYGSTSGTLTFAGTAGETQTITVLVNGDATVESDETFFVDLSNLEAAGLSVAFGDNRGVGSIVADEPLLTATKTASFVEPVRAGDVIDYVVTLTNDGAEAESVLFSDTPDPLTTPVPGSLTTTQGSVTSGNAPGDPTIVVDIGDVPGGGSSVTIAYAVTVNISSATVTNQGVFGGSNFSDLVTDDPSRPGAADATAVAISAPLAIPSLSFWGLALLALLVIALGRRASARVL